MTRDRVEPMSAALAQLMDTEREVPPLERARLERIRTGVERAIGGPGSGGGAGGGGSTSGAPRGLEHAAMGASGLGGYFAVAAGALLVGATLGALGYRAIVGATAAPSVPSLTTAPARVAVAAADADHVAHEHQVAPVDPRQGAPASGERSSVPRARGVVPVRERGTPPVGVNSAAIADEQRMIDAARGAIGRGHFDEALAAVARHELRFPNGQLAEEREVIAVQALALAGRPDAARGRAAMFFTAYPGSLLAPAVERALASGSSR